MKNSEQPAYPTVDTINPETGDRCEPMNVGLTKRELIAAMALQGMLANHLIIDTYAHNIMANEAVNFADALLTSLES